MPLLRILWLLLLLGLGMPHVAMAESAKKAVFEPMMVGDTQFNLQYAPGFSAALRQEAGEWVRRSAEAVAGYFGHFPVAEVTILLIPSAGASIEGGATFNDAPPRIRIYVGRDTSRDVFLRDWVMVHEMVHLAIPDLPESQTWFHEGIATYVEIVARAQAGLTHPDRAWLEIKRGLPQGLPEAGDRGLDFTPTWGRIYWGGAMFCLLADIEMRKQSNNQLGLQDALRGLIKAGSNYGQSWSLLRTLKTADQSIGMTVLQTLYANMKDRPVSPDLTQLWQELGLATPYNHFDDNAPLASIRRAITTPSQSKGAPSDQAIAR